MASKVIAELVDKSNEGILNAIRNDASLDYQRRIPEATKANMQDIVNNLQDNRPGYNEFVDALVNRIGLTFGRNMIWSNKLARFKIGMLAHGDTIEEYGMGLLEAHTYENDREAGEKAIFGTELPEVKAIFHKRNRQEYYKVTVNENALFSAFLTPGGISDFTTRLMQTPATSDQWDEYLMMCKLFSLYERNGGFYKVNVPDVAAIESDEVAAKGAVRAIQGITGNLQFPSTKYNPSRLPTFANPEELVLFATPEFQAAMNVEALAAAFNPDKLTMPEIITIREEDFGIDGAQAVLTTGDFFVVADQRIQTEQARNPVKMHTNFFLHHWEILSVSTFVPAVLFTTGPGTEDEPLEITPVASVTPVTFSNRENETVTEVERGEIYNVLAEAITSPAGGENDGVRFSLSGATAPRTRVTQNGVLHVGGTEGADELVITATSTWIDPSGIVRAGKTNTGTVTVTGPKSSDWPVDDDAVSAAAAFGMRSTGEIDTYENLNGTHLAELLAERGLATSGTNAEKLARLRADDAEAEKADA